MVVKEYAFVIFTAEENSDVIFAHFPQSIKVDLELAKQLISYRLDFAKGLRHYLVMDISNVKHITAQAKEYTQFAPEAVANILGAAFIAGNPVSSLFANIFIKAQNKFPSKYFSSKEDAFNWVEELKKKSPVVKDTFYQ